MHKSGLTPRKINFSELPQYKSILGGINPGLCIESTSHKYTSVKAYFDGYDCKITLGKNHIILKSKFNFKCKSCGGYFASYQAVLRYLRDGKALISFTFIFPKR